MVRHVVPDVLEMLSDGLDNADFTLLDLQQRHQLQGVLVGAVGGSEARHRDADNAVAVEAEFVERPDGDQQGQRRVESAADADDGTAASDMVQPLGQSQCLYVQDLFARLAHLVGLRDERVTADGAHQFKITRLDGLTLHHTGRSAALCIDERRIAAALRAEPFHVNLCDLDLWLGREPICLTEQVPVFADDGIAAIDHVLGRLAETAAGIDVTAHRTCTLLAEQRAQVLVLPGQLVTGREVEHQVGTGHGQRIARRHRGPDVLADLNAEIHPVAGGEQRRSGSHRNRTAG